MGSVWIAGGYQSDFARNYAPRRGGPGGPGGPGGRA